MVRHLGKLLIYLIRRTPKRLKAPFKRSSYLISIYRKLRNATPSKGYYNWLKVFEQQAVEGLPGSCTYQPLISVVVPTFNTPLQFLRECLDSVRAQSYDNWQLCLVDDASTLPHVRAVLAEYAARDSRIKYQVHKVNSHICAATNSALALATGEFVALLDHDDILAPFALIEIVKALNERPELHIIYSDEDFINEGGQRRDPHFKSDWNPELLLSHNYITHLCVYRRTLLEKVGGLRENAGVEGAQDYDLILRCSAATESHLIHHIPKVLYHWRAHTGSTALSAEEKGYTVEAGRKALRDYLASHDIGAEVELIEPDNYYRVNYATRGHPKVSLLIPTRDCLPIVKACVDSILLKTAYSNYEIVLLDNQSQEHETLCWFESISKHPKVKIIPYNAPFNYSAVNNFGARETVGELIGLINNDTEVISPDWLDEMVSLAVRPLNGCIGAKLYYPDDTIQHAGVIVGLGGYAAHSHRTLPRDSHGYFNRLNVRQNLSAVTGACLLVRRDVWEQVGGLDETFSVAYNDVDFCLRVREAGYLNVFTPFAELYHHESKSRGLENTARKRARFEEEKNMLAARWGDTLKLDPYYNPNLTHSREDFSLRDVV